MKTVTYFAAICLAVAALSCSQQTAVNADYDTTADFSKYKTYAWLDKVLPPDMIPENIGAPNQITDRRIRTALDEEMAAKGFTAVTADPDLVVFYHVGVEDKVDVTDWGYSYASTGRYWGWNTRNVDTYDYQEGTLIVDFVDAESKVLVWRGTAQRVLESVTPEEADQVIRDIVKEVMTLYPPTGQTQ
jgi:hypothetical protein